MLGSQIQSVNDSAERNRAGATRASVTDWSGGGLHVPVKPGDASSPTPAWFVLVKMTPQGFSIDTELTKPNDDIFNCRPENQVELPGFP